jgi:hypothetical protein
MSLRGKLDRLQKAMRGNLEYVELADGGRHWYDPEDAVRDLFSHSMDSLTADYRGEPRPEPPPLLVAVSHARDRGAALEALPLTKYPWPRPFDLETLVERGELVSRSLGVNRKAVDLTEEDMSERRRKDDKP